MTTKTSRNGSQLFEHSWQVVPNGLYSGDFGSSYNQVTRFAWTWTNTRTGGYNPRWRALIQKHANATTDLTGSKFELKHTPPGYLAVFQRRTAYNSNWCPPIENGISGIYSVFPNLGHFPGFANASTQDRAQSQAHASFVKKYRGKLTDFTGGVFLGELRETLELIHRPALAFREGLSAYLSKLKKAAKRPGADNFFQKYLADLWLEQAFGWSPLLGDTKAAAEALAHFLQKDRVFAIRAVGTASESVQSGVTSTQIGGLPIYFLVASKTTKTCKVIIRGAVRDSKSYPAWPSIGRLQQVCGFQLQDWTPTVWELLPWSFVVDYFFNVGEILSAVTTNWQDLAWCNRTVLLRSEQVDAASHDAERQQEYGYLGNMFIRGLSLHVDPGSMKRIASNVVRSAIYDPSVWNIFPTLRVELPGLSTKWINLVALWAQLDAVKRRWIT